MSQDCRAQEVLAAGWPEHPAGVTALRHFDAWLRAEGHQRNPGATADLVATSLTKFVVGSGDAMGGALVCLPQSPLYDELHRLTRAQHEELLWAEDAVVIEAQARGFPERMARHNANGLLMADGCGVTRRSNAYGIRSGNSTRPTRASAVQRVGTAR